MVNFCIFAGSTVYIKLHRLGACSTTLTNITSTKNITVFDSLVVIVIELAIGGPSRLAGRSNIVGEISVCPGASPRGHLTHWDISSTVDHLDLLPFPSSIALFAGGRLLPVSSLCLL